MTEGEQTRLVAWAAEMRTVHERLRAALEVTRTTIAAGSPGDAAGRDLLLFCHGFCAALNGHHEGEDRLLFPALAAEHPRLRETLDMLEQDHSMIASLLADLESTLSSSATPEVLDRHLEGVAAIMESHFRYEERQLLGLLETLELDVDPREALGPL